MKKGEQRSAKKEDSPEQVTAQEALTRMHEFVDRREEFVNAVKANKDRHLSSREKS